MEGWCPVEDLVRWAFAHAPVVMANEAHSGLARCVRTREVGVRMIQAAHEAGILRDQAPRSWLAGPALTRWSSRPTTR